MTTCGSLSFSRRTPPHRVS